MYLHITMGKSHSIRPWISKAVHISDIWKYFQINISIKRHHTCTFLVCSVIKSNLTSNLKECQRSDIRSTQEELVHKDIKRVTSCQVFSISFISEHPMKILLMPIDRFCDSSLEHLPRLQKVRVWFPTTPYQRWKTGIGCLLTWHSALWR